jgi:hypothetical protein
MITTYLSQPALDSALYSPTDFYYYRGTAESLTTTFPYTETEKGKDSILPPAPKKSFLDHAPNRVARTIAQIRTGHWLCAPYLKRTRKNRDDDVSDIRFIATISYLAILRSFTLPRPFTLPLASNNNDKGKKEIQTKQRK